MLILHPLLSWKDKMSHSPAMLLGNLILDLLGPKLVAWVKYCHKLQHLLWIMQAGQLPLTIWFSISVQLIMEWDILLLLLQMLLSTVSTSLSLTETYYHDNSYSSKTWVLCHSKSTQHSHKCTDPLQACSNSWADTGQIFFSKFMTSWIHSLQKGLVMK